jgi:hypothetical protein
VANLGGQLDIFQGGQILHQIVKLKHKANIVPSVRNQLLAAHAVNAAAVHDKLARIARVHPPQNI